MANDKDVMKMSHAEFDTYCQQVADGCRPKPDRGVTQAKKPVSEMNHYEFEDYARQVETDIALGRHRFVENTEES